MKVGFEIIIKKTFKKKGRKIIIGRDFPIQMRVFLVPRHCKCSQPSARLA